MGVSASSARVGTTGIVRNGLRARADTRSDSIDRKPIAQAKHALEKKGDWKLVLAHNVSHYLEVLGGRALLELM